MKLDRIIIAVGLLALLLSVTGCQSAGGVAQYLPFLENGIVEVGNPNGDVEDAKGMGVYRNEEFGVEITYSLRFELDEPSVYEVLFGSEQGESLAASFAWLDERENFVEFVDERRGGLEGLVSVERAGFETVLCAHEELGDMRQVECYYHRATDAGEFVMAFEGVILVDAMLSTVTGFKLIEGLSDDYKASAAGPYSEIIEGTVHNQSGPQLIIEPVDGPSETVTLIDG